MPARPDDFDYTERVNAAAIADSPDLVRKRVREQLALGASQIKLMAGGGVASSYDPLDVTQYTVPELRAAVEAAENWGTYVTVHAYTPRAVRQAIEAGVKCIDHGQLLDDATARLMAEKGIWWSLQPFVDDGTPSAFPEGSPNRLKQLEMFSGTDTAYALAKKHRIRTAWGTDILFDAKTAEQQGAKLAKMGRWYTPAEVLRMATARNAELLALAGPRTAYPGKLGVVEEGALADLMLVDGDPLANLDLVADPAKHLRRHHEGRQGLQEHPPMTPRLVVAAALSLALVAPGEAAPSLVEWSALRPPPAAEVADPFATMPDAVLDALRNLVRSRALEAQGFPVTDEVRREREAWTRQVEANGASVAALLARRDAIMAQRRTAAEGTVAALDGQAVLLPGFLLPIALEDGHATAFVFVAMPGACSHMSQPPPNQVVRVRPARPSTLVEAYEPALVAGTLRLRESATRVHVVDGVVEVRSGYAIDDADITPARATASR